MKSGKRLGRGKGMRDYKGMKAGVRYLGEERSVSRAYGMVISMGFKDEEAERSVSCESTA